MMWYMGMEDVITVLTCEQLNSSTVKKVLLDIGYGACKELYAQTSAAHLVLVHSNSEYAFTSHDLNWLEHAETVFSFQIDQNVNIFFIEMTCSIEDYYVEAAAVVKVLNVAFTAKNIFVFRVSNNIAFGIARDLEGKIHNNFAISGLINTNNMDNYEELLLELPSSDISDLPYLIICNSPQELCEGRNYDEGSYDPDYLSFLSEFESLYGVDTSIERKRFWENSRDCRMNITYKTACEELKNVVEEETVSSYEELDAAQIAEEKAKHVHISELDNNSELLGKESLGFSEEAFEDAELMLKEMMKKD